MRNNYASRPIGLNEFFSGYTTKNNFLLILAAFFFLGFFSPNNLHGQCSAIASVKFVANNPSDTLVHYGDGSKDSVLTSLEPQDYLCFDTVPFLVLLKVSPNALCQDYVVKLPLSWLCNTTGQDGIGATEIVRYSLNDESDSAVKSFDHDETIVKDSETIDGQKLMGDCTLNGVFYVSGLDPGETIVVRVDVLLDCAPLKPTGNIQGALGVTEAIEIVGGTGNNCLCDNLQGGNQTVPWKVSLPECAISCSIEKTDVSCSGGADGSAKVLIEDNFGPVTIEWSNGASDTNFIDGLTAGTYSVTVTDFLECSTTCSITIGEASMLQCTTSVVQHVTCRGGSDGQATVSASGGTEPYTYDWGDADPNALSAGTYTVTVIDANLCESTCNVIINEPPVFECTATQSTPVSCNGGSDGSATVTPKGGNGGYTYQWDDPSGQTTATATGLSAGMYKVVVTDSKGCTTMCSVEITEPEGLSCSAVQTSPVSCNGGSDGIATVNATGGKGSYSYEWSNGQTTQTATGLTAGSYSVTVTDENGCTTNCKVVITEPDPLFCEVTSEIPVSCHGGSDGKATIAVTGGTKPYMIDWGGMSPNALLAGTYTVIVKDANLCETSCEVIITEPAPLTCEITKVRDVRCNGGSDGQATVSAMGGNGDYTFDWGGLDPKALKAGPVMVTVFDAKECSATCSIIIEEPPVLEVEAGEGAIICEGGTYQLSGSASGGFGQLLYAWLPSGNLDDPTVLNPIVTSPLVTTDFELQVTDGNGCSASDFATITVLPDPKLALTTEVLSVCFGETTMLNYSASLPAGSDCEWTLVGPGVNLTSGNSDPDNGTIEIGAGLPVGLYSFTLSVKCLTDGCDVEPVIVDLLVEKCVEDCTWTPGFWKNNDAEICGVLGGTVKKFKGKRTCSGATQNIGFILCDEEEQHYTLTSDEISCLFAYSGDSRGNKTPKSCSMNPAIKEITEYFEQYPNGITLLHHILATELNLLFNGAPLGSIDADYFICVEEEKGALVADIFNGEADEEMDEIAAIQICLSEAASADDLSKLIQPLTSYNECNGDCGRPSEQEEEPVTLKESSKPVTEDFINEYQLLNLFPNPSTDLLNVEYDMDFEREVLIRILDINGQQQITEKVESIKGRNKTQLDTSMLPPGTYLVQVIDGQLVRSKRFLRVK